MRNRCVANLLVIAGLVCWPAAAEKYHGPRPPKPDIPYLQHADNLLETEILEAKQIERKNESVYVLAGATSPVGSPLAEPIFLFASEKIPPEKLALFRLDVKDGSREIAFSQKKKKDSSRPLRLSVNRIEENLYRIEANEYLDDGEYCLSPDGTNQVFCFKVY